MLWEHAVNKFGHPVLVLCDRFRSPELADLVGSAAPIESRTTRWSEAGADIRALRQLAGDGSLSVVESSRALHIVSAY